jgi:hypothetical protein
MLATRRSTSKCLGQPGASCFRQIWKQAQGCQKRTCNNTAGRSFYPRGYVEYPWLYTRSTSVYCGIAIKNCESEKVATPYAHKCIENSRKSFLLVPKMVKCVLCAKLTILIVNLAVKHLLLSHQLRHNTGAVQARNIGLCVHCRTQRESSRPDRRWHSLAGTVYNRAARPGSSVWRSWVTGSVSVRQAGIRNHSIWG